MDFLLAEPAGRYARVIAIIALLLGLDDASRLLGVQGGDTSPLAALGVAGFTFVAIFALARLFAAVGLWIKASWGAVLLVGATVVELALYAFGNPGIQIGAFGFAVRLVLLVGIVVVFFVSLRFHRARSRD